jgi:hypothetical protein
MPPKLPHPRVIRSIATGQVNPKPAGCGTTVESQAGYSRAQRCGAEGRRSAQTPLRYQSRESKTG